MKSRRTIQVAIFIGCGLFAGIVSGQQIEPTWESMAANYDPPEWFVDGKIGVWTHWGVPSSIDENRPNDGSHYGRRMYGHVEGETVSYTHLTLPTILLV